MEQSSLKTIINGVTRCISAATSDLIAESNNNGGQLLYGLISKLVADLQESLNEMKANLLIDEQKLRKELVVEQFRHVS